MKWAGRHVIEDDRDEDAQEPLEPKLAGDAQE